MKRIISSVSIITILFLGIFFFFLSCDKESSCVESPKEDCGCITVYTPVCGCNEKTYGNECEAECVGITEYTEGACE